MKTLFAFLKKEWMEQIRSGRLFQLAVVFVLFGVMNPAIAKLTPWMMELMADSLEGSGLMVTEVKVDAMTSWTQFFKNIPLGLIVFAGLFGNSFTNEYQSGSLTLVLTKGLARYKVVAAKTAIMLLLWSGAFWLCYGITYGYNAYFWDNSIAENLVFSVVGWWVLGIWMIALMVLFSVLASTSTGVLAGAGAVFLGSYVAGLFPKLQDYVPTKLMETGILLAGSVKPETYDRALMCAVVLAVVCVAVSIPIMNKRAV